MAAGPSVSWSLAWSCTRLLAAGGSAVCWPSRSVPRSSSLGLLLPSRWFSPCFCWASGSRLSVLHCLPRMDDTSTPVLTAGAPAPAPAPAAMPPAMEGGPACSPPRRPPCKPPAPLPADRTVRSSSRAAAPLPSSTADRWSAPPSPGRPPRPPPFCYPCPPTPAPTPALVLVWDPVDPVLPPPAGLVGDPDPDPDPAERGEPSGPPALSMALALRLPLPPLLPACPSAILAASSSRSARASASSSWASMPVASSAVSRRTEAPDIT